MSKSYTKEKAKPLEWDKWYTAKMCIDHLILLEDHLLDYAYRSADDQCLNCVLWHCEKLKSYCAYEAPKFFQAKQMADYRRVAELSQEIQNSLDNMSPAQASRLANEVREARYKITNHGIYDFATVAEERLEARLLEPDTTYSELMALLKDDKETTLTELLEVIEVEEKDNLTTLLDAIYNKEARVEDNTPAPELEDIVETLEGEERREQSKENILTNAVMVARWYLSEPNDITIKRAKEVLDEALEKIGYPKPPMLKDFKSELSAIPTPSTCYIYKDTIECHYRPSSSMHKGSIRVVKPTKDILVYLGCPKSARWSGKKCSTNQALVMTIMPRTQKYLDRVANYKSNGARVIYRSREGVKAQDTELDAVKEALKNTKVVELKI